MLRDRLDASDGPILVGTGATLHVIELLLHARKLDPARSTAFACAGLLVALHRIVTRKLVATPCAFDAHRVRLHVAHKLRLWFTPCRVTVAPSAGTVGDNFTRVDKRKVLFKATAWDVFSAEVPLALDDVDVNFGGEDRQEICWGSQLGSSGSRRE
jgi:hypothetical protein